MRSLSSSRFCVFAALSSSLFLLSACSAGSGEDSDDLGGGGTSSGVGGGSVLVPGAGGQDGIVVTAAGGASAGGADPGTGGTMENLTQFSLPAGFEPAEGAESGMDADTLAGGYRLVGALADIDVTASQACGNILRVVVRDFEPTHDDFGAPKTPEAVGMVGPMGAAIGADFKPVRDATVFPEDALAFDDWYRHGAAIDNVPYLLDIWLEPTTAADGTETFVFDSSRFFPLPIDGVTTNADLDRVMRNFGFTTELHTQFEYKGGEVFSFRGDDDVFVYINGGLVVDLGGVHGPQVGEVQLDTLGLTVGVVYTFDLFQAERNPTGSNFRLETSLDFTGCGELLPGDIIIK